MRNPSSALDAVGARVISPNPAKPKRKYLFIFWLDAKEPDFMLLLGAGQASP
jgi:hypothetical protein